MLGWEQWAVLGCQTGMGGPEKARLRFFVE